MSKIRKNQLIAKMIIILILGIVSFCFGFKKCGCEEYYYTENSVVDYKVYLKKNSFFDKPYLEKNKTYITSLIDYIDADFKYNVKFENKVNGQITYQLIATIKADKTGSEIGNYWTKEYELTKLETAELKQQKDLTLELNNKIDYNNYNKILKQFIKEYDLDSDSILKVSLVINGGLKEIDSKQPIELATEVSMEMPLSKKAIEGKINVQSNSERDKKVSIDRFEGIRNIVKILFYIEVVIFCYNLFQYIQGITTKVSKLSYRDKVKRIASEYESIIAVIKSPNIDNYSIIDVITMDDLINIYNNTREPINFWYGIEKSMFFIINNSTCYVYTIVNEGKK